MPSISVSTLIAATNTANHYGYVSWLMSAYNMSYSKNSEIFKFDHESYRFVKNEVEPKFPKVPKVPKIDDEDKD